MNTVNPEVSDRILLPDGMRINATAYYLGEHIDVRSLAPRLGANPVVVTAGPRGWAVIFRYGAAVLVGIPEPEHAAFLESLKPLVSKPFSEPEREPVEIELDARDAEGADPGGVIRLREATVGRLQVVAEVLAKSVALARYEAAIADVFASVEPLAEALERHGRGAVRRVRPLLKQIGGMLRIQHQMVGRVEVSEKPELLWENAALERIYLLLADEYELKERHKALEQKLAVVSNTVETLLELLQHRRSLRVEWYIVLLIVVSILLHLYEMTMH